MSPTDEAEAFAALHAAAFAGSPVRPWSAASFAALLVSPGTVLFREGPEAPVGIAVTRQVLDEVEVLTLAVTPTWRRRGIGRGLMAKALEAARVGGAERAFLEVAATNAAARALYTGLGFVETGLRRGYYRSTTVDDAVTMVKALQP